MSGSWHEALAWIGALIVTAGLAGCSAASEPARVASVDWTITHPRSGTVVDGTVEIRTAGSGGSFPLVSIHRPSVDGPGFTLCGEVRYHGVHPAGYLEMWSSFPDGGRYYTRTLSASGPEASLDGDGPVRPFELPFHLGSGSAPPTRLDIDVVLPGAGAVWIGPLELDSMTNGTQTGAWWSDRAGGLLGGVAGSLLGLTGAILGASIARRRFRSVVLATTAVLAIGGLGILGVGLLGLAGSQPYAVWYPLVLGGALLVVMFGGLRRMARHAYTDAELRRMRAADLTRP